MPCTTHHHQATVAGDAVTIAELRSRVQAAESRLADEVSGRQELFGRHKALEADFTLLSVCVGGSEGSRASAQGSQMAFPQDVAGSDAYHGALGNLTGAALGSGRLQQ